MTVANKTAAQQAIDAARAKLDQPKPEAFRFGEDGNEISGTVVRLEMGETPYGKCPIVVIDTGNGTLRSVWLTHKALRGAVTRVRPQVGDGIAIRCLGERESGTGRTYTDYSAATDRDQTFSWDDDDRQQQQEQNPFDGEPPF